MEIGDTDIHTPKVCNIFYILLFCVCACVWVPVCMTIVHISRLEDKFPGYEVCSVFLPCGAWNTVNSSS